MRISKLPYLLILIVTLSSCKSEHSIIQKRKYTHGYHIWGQGKKQKSTDPAITVIYVPNGIVEESAFALLTDTSSDRIKTPFLLKPEPILIQEIRPIIVEDTTKREILITNKPFEKEGGEPIENKKNEKRAYKGLLGFLSLAFGVFAIHLVIIHLLILAVLAALLSIYVSFAVNTGPESPMMRTYDDEGTPISKPDKVSIGEIMGTIGIIISMIVIDYLTFLLIFKLLCLL